MVAVQSQRPPFRTVFQHISVRNQQQHPDVFQSSLWQQKPGTSVKHDPFFKPKPDQILSADLS